MSAAKTFDEWWLEKSYMCWAGVTHSAKEAWNAALESVEIAPSASANSDYAAALQDLKMFIHGRLQVHPELQCELGFIWERLNALKAEHFA